MSTIQLHRASAIGACLLILVLAFGTGGRPLSFVDAHAYSAGIRDHLMGADAYAPRSPLNFVYPPFFLLAASAAAKIVPLAFLKTIYICFHLIAVLSLPAILYRYYLGQSNWSLISFYGLFFLAPGLLGLLALDTGNIALICYASTLLAGARGIQSNRWTVFYLVAFCCAMIKVTFVPLLLLPLLCGTGQMLKASLCGASVLIGSELQVWLTPDLYRRFKEAAARQLIELGDNGKGVFGIVFHLLHKAHISSVAIPVLAYGCVAACVLACLVVIRQRGLHTDFAPWPAVVLAGSLFVTPRVNYYDLCLAFPLLFCICTEGTGRVKALGIYIAVLVPGVALLMRMPDSAFNGGFEALLILAMLLLVFWRVAFKQTFLVRTESRRS